MSIVYFPDFGFFDPETTGAVLVFPALFEPVTCFTCPGGAFLTTNILQETKDPKAMASIAAASIFFSDVIFSPLARWPLLTIDSYPRGRKRSGHSRMEAHARLGPYLVRQSPQKEAYVADNADSLARTTVP